MCGSVAPVVGHPLGEQREDVRAVGVERLVERRRDDAVAERRGGRPALAGVLEGPLDELHGRRHLDRAGVVLGLAVARVGGEAGSSVEREVDLHDAAARAPALDVADEVVGQVRGARRARGTRACGCRLVTTTGARSSSPSVEHGALDPAVADQQRARRGASVRTSAPNDSARPADRRRTTAPMPPSGKPQLPSWPSPTSPIEWCAMTYAVPGSYGPGPGADHAVDRQRALDLRRLEPVVEQVGDAHRHQPGHVGDRAHVEAAVAPGQPGQRRPGRRARASRSSAAPSAAAGRARRPARPARRSTPPIASASLRRPLRDLARGCAPGRRRRS